MAIPSDAYPITTQDGTQIRMDVVRIKLLDYIDFVLGTGSVVNVTPIEVDGLYVLYATEDCIVDLKGVAVNNPVGKEAVLVLKGERVTCMIPVGSTSFSAIGLNAGGRLYIQRLTAWAGLANATTLGNQ